MSPSPSSESRTLSVDEPVLCPECGSTPASGGFCPNCGQRLAVGPLRFVEVAKEFLGTLSTFEFPILLTVRDLLRGPGAVASAWIAGRRRSYINPIKFIVIVGVIVALTYLPLIELQASARAATGAVYKVGLAHYADQYFAFFCIVLLLPIAVAQCVIAAKFGVKRAWLEWYALGLYTFGLGALLQLGWNLVSLALPSSSTVRVIELVLPVILFAWGAFGFAERGRRARSLAASLLALALVLGGVALARTLWLAVGN